MQTPFSNDFTKTDIQQVVGFLAAGLTYATAIVNTLVYSSDPAKEASAAGFILLSMVMVCAMPRPKNINWTPTR